MATQSKTSKQPAAVPFKPRKGYRYNDLYQNLLTRKPTVVRLSPGSDTGLEGLARSIMTTLRRWRIEQRSPIPAGYRATLVRNPNGRQITVQCVKEKA